MTKKMLVPIDMENPEKNFNDFLYLDYHNGMYVFRGIKSGKFWKNGVVSYVGKDISKNDVLEKITNSGNEIENENTLLEITDKFLEEIKKMKLGNVAAVINKNDFFEIESLGKKPRIKRNKLP